MNLQEEQLNISPENDAKRYNRIKVIISFIDLIISILFITILAFSGISKIIVSQIDSYVLNPYLQFLIFLHVVGLASIVTF